jgi:hypothetical protein
MVISDFIGFQQKYRIILIGIVLILSFSLYGQTDIGFANPSFGIPGMEKQQGRDNLEIMHESWMAEGNIAFNFSSAIEVINYSFELPGLEKIKGWDGECRDPGWTGLLYDIEGWTSVAPAWDSGVETGFTPTDGDWTAFIMGGDSAVYQITGHVIQEGDEIEMLVDARITWAAMFLKMGFFYEENGTQVPLEAEIWELLETMEEYFLMFSAADHPDAVGRNLGILFDNVSDSSSWIGIDNVRLNNSNANVAVDNMGELEGFALSQNFPNPFNPDTHIHYCLKTAGQVRLSVFDASGRKVAVLVNGIQEAGDHYAVFNGMNLDSGIYFYRMQNGERTVTRKMMLLK